MSTRTRNLLILLIGILLILWIALNPVERNPGQKDQSITPVYASSQQATEPHA